MMTRSEQDERAADAAVTLVERTDGPSPRLQVADGPAAPLPPRTLADLLAEVILRGKSLQTRNAYRADLEDFLVWLLGRSVHLPAEPERLRVDPQAAQAV